MWKYYKKNRCIKRYPPYNPHPIGREDRKKAKHHHRCETIRSRGWTIPELQSVHKEILVTTKAIQNDPLRHHCMEVNGRGLEPGNNRSQIAAWLNLIPQGVASPPPERPTASHKHDRALKFAHGVLQQFLGGGFGCWRGALVDSPDPPPGRGGGVVCPSPEERPWLRVLNCRRQVNPWNDRKLTTGLTEFWHEIGHSKKVTHILKRQN